MSDGKAAKTRDEAGRGWKRRLAGYGPALPWPHGGDLLKASLGAALGLLTAALVVLVWPAGAGLYLVAPLGATAVLVFCVPNAPLAQPWSALVGNMISAALALLVLWLVPPGPWQPALAVGGAIAAMMLTRSLHPPGGAVALLTVLAPEPALAAGPLYILAPIGLTTGLLVAAGVVFHRFSGRAYPFRLPPAAPPSETAATAQPRLGLDTDDLAALLDEFHQTANLGVADLGRLLAAAEREAAEHRFDGTACADIMTRDPLSVAPDTRLRDVARLMRDHGIKSLPVVDAAGVAQGVVQQADLIDGLTRQRGMGPMRPAALQSRLDAGRIMRPVPLSVPQGWPVGRVLNRMAEGDVQSVLLSDPDGRLTGILTRSDILALLLRGAGARPETDPEA
ncbi:HPP family protein [Roseovarius sp. C7]|uniref:HPP family protein n=1 Tax=Roseovarius sp. C7 TaxID=3398643 RepID=UPI0039F72507